jgi:hypothetical protein
MSLDPGSLKSRQSSYFGLKNESADLKGGQENFGRDAARLGDAVHLVTDSWVSCRRDRGAVAGLDGRRSLRDLEQGNKSSDGEGEELHIWVVRVGE